MRIAFACDHAGFALRQIVLDHVKSLGHAVLDMGTDSEISVDYPYYGHAAARQLAQNKADRAIVICGSGIGMSIVANKTANVRCALCYSPELAEMARLHNDANALALGARYTDAEMARTIITAFLQTEFSGGRHARRVNAIENKNINELAEAGDQHE
jgi:ribose 5-phosphate isomerase B